MDEKKEELLQLLNCHFAELLSLTRAVNAVKSRQVETAKLKSQAKLISRTWFDTVRPRLELAQIADPSVDWLSSRFEALLQASRVRSSKSSYLGILSEATTRYQNDLIHRVEIADFSFASGLSISRYIEGLPKEEGTYLDEAQRCLSVRALKGCIVLGWCATVARIHEKIVEIGFDQFNVATEQMVARTFGRFKLFTRRHRIASLSELQQVFDTDILWVLEFLQLIDSNEHQRLRSCFDLRNNCAHPGQAPVEPENVAAFYSDITRIVLKNPKFEIAGPV